MKKILALVGLSSINLFGCGAAADHLSLSAADVRQPVLLNCSYSFLEGEDQHPVQMTYTFADPTAGRAPIEWTRWSKDTFSGHETSTTRPMFPVTSQGYPRIDREPNGNIEILATKDGTVGQGAIPALEFMVKFTIRNYASSTPTLIVQHRYTEGTWLPAETLSCVKP